MIATQPLDSAARANDVAGAASGAVLLIAYDFPPATAVGAQRTLRFARYLPEMGWRPVVLTARAVDYQGVIDPAALDRIPRDVSVHRAAALRPLRPAIRFRDWLRSFHRPGGQTGVRPGSDEGQTGVRPGSDPSGSTASRTSRSAPRGASWMQRWIEPWISTPDEQIQWLPMAVLRGLRAIRQERIDVLFTTGPPHSVHLCGLILKLLTGRPWVADFRDPWTRRPWLRDADKSGLRYWTQVKLEALVARHADALVLNTAPMGQEFSAFHKLGDRCTVITNGYDPEAFAGVSFDTPAAPPPVVLTHAGALYRRRDPRPLLEAIAVLRDRGSLAPGQFRLDLIGHIDAEFDIASVIAARRLEGFVSRIPQVTHRESLRRLASSHALLLIQPETHLQIPGKLFEYMYLKRPILALTGPGATADIVRENALGVVAEPTSVPEIAGAIQRLIAVGGSGYSAGDASGRFHGRALTRDLADVFGRVRRSD